MIRILCLFTLAMMPIFVASSSILPDGLTSKLTKGDPASSNSTASTSPNQTASATAPDASNINELTVVASSGQALSSEQASSIQKVAPNGESPLSGKESSELGPPNNNSPPSEQAPSNKSLTDLKSVSSSNSEPNDIQNAPPGPINLKQNDKESSDSDTTGAEVTTDDYDDGFKDDNSDEYEDGVPKGDTNVEGNQNSLQTDDTHDGALDNAQDDDDAQNSDPGAVESGKDLGKPDTNLDGKISQAPAYVDTGSNYIIYFVTVVFVVIVIYVGYHSRHGIGPMLTRLKQFIASFLKRSSDNENSRSNVKYAKLSTAGDSLPTAYSKEITRNYIY